MKTATSLGKLIALVVVVGLGWILLAPYLPPSKQEDDLPRRTVIVTVDFTPTPRSGVPTGNRKLSDVIQINIDAGAEHRKPFTVTSSPYIETFSLRVGEVVQVIATQNYVGRLRCLILPHGFAPVERIIDQVGAVRCQYRVG